MGDGGETSPGLPSPPMLKHNFPINPIWILFFLTASKIFSHNFVKRWRVSCSMPYHLGRRHQVMAICEQMVTIRTKERERRVFLHEVVAYFKCNNQVLFLYMLWNGGDPLWHSNRHRLQHPQERWTMWMPLLIQGISPLNFRTKLVKIPPNDTNWKSYYFNRLGVHTACYQVHCGQKRSLSRAL